MARKKKTSIRKKATAKKTTTKKSPSRKNGSSSSRQSDCQQRYDDRLATALNSPLARFHKRLEHNPATGEVDADQFSRMIHQLRRLNSNPDSEAKNGFQLVTNENICDSSRKFVNPQSGWALDSQMTDPCCHNIPAPPAFESEMAAAEMIELYWMALLRDVPFTEWEDHEQIAVASAELSDLPMFINRRNPNADPNSTNAGFECIPINAKSIFRGGELARFSNNSLGISENVGPFISQFLLQEIPYGTLRIPQRFIHAAPGVDYMTEWNEWLQVQDGKRRNDRQNLIGVYDPNLRRYLSTMRDLATYVHFDALYQAYLNAALILLGGGYSTNKGNPYGPGCSVNGIGQDYRPLQHQHTHIKSGWTNLYPDQDGFGTFGGPHILSLVTEVATRALKAVWRQKWTHLRLRPEAYAGFIHRDQTNEPTSFDGFSPQVERMLRSSDAIRQFREGKPGRRGRRWQKRQASTLLPMAFPEGSPTHPSYGAGHATVAGACVTVLKAFFNGDAQIIGPVHASSDGQYLIPYQGSDIHSGRMTVELELNKLAANIAIGRDMAGVHWRSDYTQSMLLGQRVTLDILYRQSATYTENYWFILNSFGGKQIKVGAGEIYYDGQQIVSSGSVDPFAPTLREHCILAEKLAAVI